MVVIQLKQVETHSITQRRQGRKDNLSPFISIVFLIISIIQLEMDKEKTKQLAIWLVGTSANDLKSSLQCSYSPDHVAIYRKAYELESKGQCRVTVMRLLSRAIRYAGEGRKRW